MLTANHFYYRTIRRNVIAFGTIFKNIEMATYSANTGAELSRINVPLTYAGKEDFLTRLLGNPDLHKPTQITLPRMSFEMTGITYDSSRKISSYLSSFNKIGGTNSEVYQQYSGVPYNMDFELNIYVRNVEDGTQIVEQILPFFNPDYTVSMSFVDQMNIMKEVPIILEDIKYDPNYQGTEGTTRILTWTLTFKMKTYFFGPINTGKIIRKSVANALVYTDSLDTMITLNMDSGFGDYKIGEIVYQGLNLPDATISANVISWDNISNTLILTKKQGDFFNVSANVIGTDSNASRQIIKYDPSPHLFANVAITPTPVSANLGDDFGFVETITYALE
jgi:T4-like virus Myoviridae tail sheath stabiliser